MSGFEIVVVAICAVLGFGIMRNILGSPRDRTGSEADRPGDARDD